MNNIIMIRINGTMTNEFYKAYRPQILKDIKDGLFIVDDTVKDVVVTTIDNLGIEED